MLRTTKRIATTLAYLSVIGIVNAAETSSTQPAESNTPIGNVARIIWLDKQTNTRQMVTLTTGQAQTLGTLAVQMEKCIPDVDGRPNTDTAWLHITEPGRGNDWFKGWMVNTMPEIAALEHPRYDVQVIGCGTKARLRSGPVAKSGKFVDQGVDSESLATDPFAVPGVPDATTTTTVVEDAPAEVEAPQPELQPTEEPTPAAEAEPVAIAPSEEPTTPAAEPTPAPAEQDQLHNMMDGGVY